MARRKTFQTLMALVTLVLLGASAMAAPKKAASHVQEQDVTLDDDSDDEAPKKKKPQAEPEDESDEDDEEKPEPKPEVAPAGPHKPGCTSDLECDGRAVCRDGRCVSPEEPAAGAEGAEGPGVWLALGLMQDFALTSGSDVCSEKSQVSGGYTCIRASGSQYHGIPIAGAGGKLGGLSLGGTRVTLASFFRLANKISAGLRLGYAFLGQGPTPDGGHQYLAVSAEAQGAYWFSKQAFSTKAIGTFVELSAGLAEVDGKGKVTVKENQAVPPPVSQVDNPATQSLTAYQKAGAGFAGVGAGMFFPAAGHFGLIADLRVIQLFPSSGTALSLDVSGAFGL